MMPKFTLRGLRANYGLTANTVAKDVDVHVQTLLKYEKDSSKIPMDLLKKLSIYYNCPIDNIFLGKKYELNHI